MAEILGYTVASGRGAATEPQVTHAEENRADVVEAVGKQMLEEAQAAGDAHSRTLRSVDELLMDANISGGRETPARRDSTHFESRRSWSSIDGQGWGGAARYVDCWNGPASGAQDGSSNGRKLNLNVRDVDDEVHGDGPEWVASHSYGGRKLLSKSDLKALLSESAESRDSI